MEQKFLMYLLKEALLEIRVRAYENNDKKNYSLCDLLHNVPFSLISDEWTKDSYNYILENAKHSGLGKWLENRQDEFHNQFPEYQISK